MPKIKIVLLCLLLIIVCLIFVVFYQLSNNVKGAKTAANKIAAAPRPFIYYNHDTNESKTSVNILLLGLDSRIGDSKPRCDGIHMISFLEEEKEIIITSVPRGTYISLPEVASESAYISNACHYKGIDYAVAEIEKITGIHPDYLIKVGFSQTTGILRLLNLPATDTLQFLRNRRYGLGDFQRSHNQALFLKDMFTQNLDTFAAMPKAIKYLIYSLLDTNLDFITACDLLDKIKNSGLYTNPENIILAVRPTPNYQLRDIHFSQIAENNPTNDAEFEQYQNEVVNSILNIVQRANPQMVATAFNQRLWEQIADEKTRNDLHFQLLKLYAAGSAENKIIITDFIEEMKVYKDEENQQKAQELLNNI